jgi:hypothetical protein
MLSYVGMNAYQIPDLQICVFRANTDAAGCFVAKIGEDFEFSMGPKGEVLITPIGADTCLVIPRGKDKQLVGNVKKFTKYVEELLV